VYVCADKVVSLKSQSLVVDDTKSKEKCAMAFWMCVDQYRVMLESIFARFALLLREVKQG
jgi:hypothetical protein